MLGQGVKMNIIRTPEVGDKVYYKSYGTPGGEFESLDRVAFITEVIDNDTVSLAVLNPTGMFFNQEVTRGGEGGQWNWIGDDGLYIKVEEYYEST